LGFGLIFFLIAWFFLKLSKKQIKNFILKSCFECGFEKSQNRRQSFSLRFFFILILFVIFDVELILLFQLPLQIKKFFKCRKSIYFFVIILLFGLFEE